MVVRTGWYFFVTGDKSDSTSNYGEGCENPKCFLHFSECFEFLMSLIGWPRAVWDEAGRLFPTVHTIKIVVQRCICRVKTSLRLGCRVAGISVLGIRKSTHFPCFGTLIFSRPASEGAHPEAGLFICFSFLSLIYNAASSVVSPPSGWRTMPVFPPSEVLNSGAKIRTFFQSTK